MTRPLPTCRPVHRPDAGLGGQREAGGRHPQVPLRQRWRNGLLGPAGASPPLLLVFFGECRRLGLLAGLALLLLLLLLLLVLHSAVAVPAQEVVLRGGGEGRQN